MEVFSSKKGKIVFWSYLILSLMVLVKSFLTLNALDQSSTGSYLGQVLSNGGIASGGDFIAAQLLLAIPLSYIIMLGFVVVKFKNHRAKLNNYKKFEDYPLEIQEKELNEVFCFTCKSYPGASFESGQMEEGMRIIYGKCKKCQNINKHRMT